MIIAIFTGGDSSEQVISVRSAAKVKSWLEEAGHRCYLVNVSAFRWMVDTPDGEVEFDRGIPGFVSAGETIRVEYIWNMIHGTPGEDGLLQGCLDMMELPYSSCGLLTSALTFNKYACKVHLKQHGILTPEAALIRKKQMIDLDEIVDHIGLPCFVKPNKGGSSFGISKVSRRAVMAEAVRKALEEDQEVIVEGFVKGRELTCGLMRKAGELRVFPLTEVSTENEFFDFEAKYTPGKSREITPAQIDEDIAELCREQARKIYEILDCRGIVRIDFIVSGKQAFFLELNSIPGMSNESVIPQQIQSMGMQVKDVLQEVIDESI